MWLTKNKLRIGVKEGNKALKVWALPICCAAVLLLSSSKCTSPIYIEELYKEKVANQGKYRKKTSHKRSKAKAHRATRDRATCRTKRNSQHYSDDTSTGQKDVTFTLTDICLQTGETKSMTLSASHGIEYTEGYKIKSVKVLKHTSTYDYASSFGIKQLTNQVITDRKLAFDITNNTKKQAQDETYNLSIKLGKSGSSMADQIVCAKIYCIGDSQEKSKHFIDKLRDSSRFCGDIGKIVAGSTGETCGRLVGCTMVAIDAVKDKLAKMGRDQHKSDPWPIQTQKTAPTIEDTCNKTSSNTSKTEDNKKKRREAMQQRMDYIYHLLDDYPAYHNL